MKVIEVDKLLNYLKNCEIVHFYGADQNIYEAGQLHAYAKIKNYVSNLESIDAEPTIHAHWMSEDGECSHCHRCLTEIMDSDSYFSWGLSKNNFKMMLACPWCKAIMDEEEKE